MTIDEAITMLNAKAECINKVCKGIYEECNEEMCDNCDLCYAQGNNGEQKELCLFCVEWLYELKDLRKWKEQEEKACDRFYQQGRVDALTEMITHISACENEAYDNVEPIIGSVLMAIRLKAEQLKNHKS